MKEDIPITWPVHHFTWRPAHNITIVGHPCVDHCIKIIATDIVNVMALVIVFGAFAHAPTL